jgi:hypothetical protein
MALFLNTKVRQCCQVFTPGDFAPLALCSPLISSLEGSDGLRRSFPTKMERAGAGLLFFLTNDD